MDVLVSWMDLIGWLALGIVALIASGFALSCLLERRMRAFAIALALALPALLVMLAVLLVEFEGRDVALVVLLSSFFLFALAMLLPLGRALPVLVAAGHERVDERDALFHRFYRLKADTQEFEAYYKDHPEKRKFDDGVRTLPELAAPSSRSYHRLSSPFQVAAFKLFEEISREIEWRPTPLDAGPVRASPEEFTRSVKGFARYLGADLVGCTRLNPAWVYSHIGRSPGTWGAQVRLDHPHAVALAVRMSHDMVRLAPGAPTTTETAWRYFQSGTIAMLLARYINLLGFEARAHVDGNYRVMCVPVAADAGLGELGRLGLLITPAFGPRVRLVVVTTDLPLVHDRQTVFGVQHFCTHCKKCATICPSGSVDSGQKRIVAGVEKWQSRQDSCFRHWRKQGSDCSLCAQVCPYSHPSTFSHNVVRWLVGRNALARRLMLRADDLFYGGRPRVQSSHPDWHPSVDVDL